MLLDKYLFQRPTYRLLESLKNYGLELAQGTLTDGMKRLAPLFEPIFHELLAKNLEEKHWHADETRWLVFQDIEGKEGHRWYLWVFASSSSVVYVLDPSRSSEVVKSHFGTDAQGIVSADRYGAYKVLVKSGRFLIAFCWAHVRRDFLKVGKGYPEHGEWADEWVERIGKLYGLNQQRIAARAEQNAEAYAQANQEPGSWLDEMAEARDAQLLDEPPEEKAKPLTSLTRHWSGLSLFLDHPEIPLDNNEAERLLRSSVVGRKNYYGSGSVWSGKLAAILFSIFQTLRRWRLNPRLWLISYLEACAQNRGEAPSDARCFLPWNMKEEERQALSIEVNDTS